MKRDAVVGVAGRRSDRWLCGMDMRKRRTNYHQMEADLDRSDRKGTLDKAAIVVEVASRRTHRRLRNPRGVLLSLKRRLRRVLDRTREKSLRD